MAMQAHTNMPELLNRFMETSNIAIKPLSTRVHRLVILRFVFSFGQCSDVATCIQKLVDAGVDIGQFNSSTIEVEQFLRHSARSMVTFALIPLLLPQFRVETTVSRENDGLSCGHIHTRTRTRRRVYR
jgi:hypothetical protein